MKFRLRNAEKSIMMLVPVAALMTVALTGCAATVNVAFDAACSNPLNSFDFPTDRDAYDDLD